MNKRRRRRSRQQREVNHKHDDSRQINNIVEHQSEVEGKSRRVPSLEARMKMFVRDAMAIMKMMMMRHRRDG